MAGAGHCSGVKEHQGASVAGVAEAGGTVMELVSEQCQGPAHDRAVDSREGFILSQTESHRGIRAGERCDKMC